MAGKLGSRGKGPSEGQVRGAYGTQERCRGGGGQPPLPKGVAWPRGGARAGRGAAGKQPFVAAVSTSDDRRPRKIKLLPVKGFRKKEIRKLVAEHLASTSRLVTDGLSCWTAAAEAGLEHTAMVTGGGKRAAG